MSNSINKNFKKKRRPQLGLDQLYAGIIEGNITILGQAITLLESSRPEDQRLANDLIKKCLPHSGNSVRIGITGVPGVGKSTFIESFGNFLTQQGKKVTVLAIDPSSQQSGGSILGDKTRMESLVQNPDVYIRPTPSRGSLGGVAKATRESILLCEAAGFDIILIETVGVGQSEIAVRSMVDFFLLLMLSGAGDELQGIKRGIMEMADALVITKADGDNKKLARAASLEYKNALHLFPLGEDQWSARVATCSALENEGLDDVWEIIRSYENHTKVNGFFDQQRKEQDLHWFQARIKDLLLTHFENDASVKDSKSALIDQIANGTISPFAAAEEVLGKYLKHK